MATVISIGTALLLIGGLVIVGFPGPSSPAVTIAAVTIAVAAIGWALWQLGRDRAKYEARLRTHDVKAATATERLAVARDLHDIVSHGLGLITTRAAVTLRIHPDDPASLRAALLDIEQASRATTTELRRMLRVLRGESPPLTPSPDIAGIAGLAAHARDLGSAVNLTGEDTLARSEGVGVTAYRIVHEALMNVARHAGPTSVRIVLAHHADVLRITVADAGPVPGWVAVPGAGHGLLGLRERVAAMDGTLEVVESDDGWTLRAVLPDPGDRRD